LASLGHPCIFQRVSRLGSVTARHCSGRHPNFAALNTGRHLYSARRPPRWALAHILVFMAALCNRGAIIFLSCGFYLSSSFFFYSSPNLSGRRFDVYYTSTRGVALISANLICRSETCCTRLAGNAGRKKVAKNHRLGTIAQLCRTVSSQLIARTDNRKKNLLSSDMSSICPNNMVNFGLLTAEIDPVV